MNKEYMDKLYAQSAINQKQRLKDLREIIKDVIKNPDEEYEYQIAFSKGCLTKNGEIIFEFGDGINTFLGDILESLNFKNIDSKEIN